MYHRYAIFYTPSAGAFADFGAAWLGWDSASGQGVMHPTVPGLDLAALTATPRKYGFHATLKAPFHLAHDTTEQALRSGVDAFAATHASVGLKQLTLSTQGGFLTLRPTADPAALRALVSGIVRDLDVFRAPLTQADIARRRKARLTHTQDQQMLDWGYPFVFDDFHFHMTLTGRLRRDQDALVMEQAAQAVAPALPNAPVLDAITLMGQDAAGMFHQLHRAVLVG